jgi:hypothetical protein
MANPAVGLGFKSYWQFGREAVYGTAVAATHKLDLMNADVPIVQGIIRDESLWGNMSRQILYQGGYMYRGKIKVRCQYEGLAMLLDWVMGTGAYGSVGGSDSGVVNGIYTHTFLQQQYLNSYTVELIEGDISAGKCFKLTGVVVDSITITGRGGANDAMLTVELDVIAQDKVSGATPTAGLKTPELSLAAYTPVLFYQAAFNDGTVDVPVVKDFSVTIANNLSARWVGQKILQPVRDNFIDVKTRFTQEFMSTTLFDAARSFTGPGPAIACYFSDTRAPGVRSLNIQITAAKLLTYSPPINKYGIIESTAEWESYYSAADTGSVLIALGNTKATVSTAYA